jgi:hypothetical protein
VERRLSPGRARAGRVTIGNHSRTSRGARREPRGSGGGARSPRGRALGRRQAPRASQLARTAPQRNIGPARLFGSPISPRTNARRSAAGNGNADPETDFPRRLVGYSTWRAAGDLVPPRTAIDSCRDVLVYVVLDDTHSPNVSPGGADSRSGVRANVATSGQPVVDLGKKVPGLRVAGVHRIVEARR